MAATGTFFRTIFFRLCFATTLIFVVEQWSIAGWSDGSHHEDLSPLLDTATKHAKPSEESPSVTQQERPKDNGAGELFTIEHLKGTISEDTIANIREKTEDWEKVLAARQPILDILRRANINVDNDIIRLLPAWSQVSELYGSKPVVFGQDTCKEFRDLVPRSHRFVGVAGLFNTGTNALFNFIHKNMEILENEINHGVLPTVPWNKHGWVALRFRNMYQPPDEHSNVFPVVIIRDPYFWMKSMCESPYSLAWKKSKAHCPNLIEESTIMNADIDSHTRDIPSSMGNYAKVTLGNWSRAFPSMAHTWSMWNNEYVQAQFPRMIIRFEDLIFHTEDVLHAIQECVGATMTSSTIVYPTASAKLWNPVFRFYKVQSGFVTALIKYGQDRDGSRYRNMTTSDLEYASSYLSDDLMTRFNYRHPKP